jgi:hypothetical protein
MVNVLLCSRQWANRPAKITEVILDVADGLNWPTICKYDVVYSVPVEQLMRRRGMVVRERRREIAIRVIRGVRAGRL